MNGNRVISLMRYSLKTLWRTLGSFIILFLIETVGVYLLTTSVLLYKCSGDVIKASSLPYSGYYIIATESSKEEILTGKTVNYYGGYDIFKLLQAHECVEDIVYSADDTIMTNISAISLDESINNVLPVIALFSSALESNFRSGKNILIEGRHIVRGDIDCILISNELAKLNNLSVGDTIELGQRNHRDYRIVGIYKNVNSDASILTYEDIPSNMMYISHGNGYYAPYTHDVLVKFVDGMGDKTVDEFCNYINEFTWSIHERLYFISVDELNRTSEGGVNVIYDITLTLSIMISVTMVFIIGLIIYYHILSRQKEIGMLRTIGTQCISVIFLTELGMITVFSSITGAVLACITSKSIMSRVFGLINDFLNTSNAYNTNSIVISGAIVKQQTILEYMTTGTYVSCSALSMGVMLLSVIAVTLLMIHQAKQISPIAIMGRQ